jgi:carboxymethylenebutenolidase
MNDFGKEPLCDSQLLSLEGGKTTWTRREFVVSSIATGFALAVQPVSAQTIKTDTEGLVAGEVKIPVKDGHIPAYRAMPATGTNFPTILVVHEIWSVHEYIQDVCRRLAKVGYLAVAPDLYARQGDVTKYKENKEILANVVSKVPDAQVMSDLDATAAWAGKSGGDAKRLGITGFCWGGRIVWMYTAHNQNVRAGVAWYGPFVRSFHPGDKTVLEVVDRINAPVLGLYGSADGGIPNDTVEQMREALKKAGKKSEIVLYPDMPHAFHADYRKTYRKEAADDGWRRLLEWFKKHGVA